MKRFVAGVILMLAGSLLLNADPSAGFRLALIHPLGAESEEAAIAGTALRRIPEIQGIPYAFLDAPNALGKFDVAVLAAGPSNRVLTPGWREALYAFVEEGGVLLAPGPLGSELFPLFGIESITSKKARKRLSFSSETADPLTAYIDRPQEQTISLGNGSQNIYREVIWSHGATPDPLSDVLGSFEDGSAALLRNYYGRGIAYYLGVSFEETVLLPQTGGDYEAQRRFANGFEPSADVIMLLVKALYEAYSPLPVYLSPIPQARSTALVLSHDVDAQTSFVDSLKFASLAEEFGTRASFFINTKYFTDDQDIGYYTVPENIEAVRELHRRGHDIGSHTVAHSLEFTSAPPGSPRVDFSRYRPQQEVTINGEVRVSRELLDRDIHGQNTVAFRAGYLAFPPELISILEEAGYLYDSSFSANDVLTAFPFFALPERRPGAAESNIVEIPVTLDDSQDFLTASNTDRAVRQWEQVFDANAANEAITVLLVHPSDTRTRSYKLEAQQALMLHARKSGAWMGPISAFGAFWRARHAVTVKQVEQGVNGISIQLNRNAESIDPLIGIVIPRAFAQKGVLLLDAGGRELPVRIRNEGKKAYLSLQ